MNQQEIDQCLHEKLGILQQIEKNTAILMRFVHRRDMTGMRRLLREQEKLIHALAAVHERMADCARPQGRSAEALCHTVESLQTGVLAAHAKLLEEALGERSKIAADLKNVRLKRNITNRYLGYGAAPRPGRRFNKRG